MRLLVVTADDFGYSQERNNGIVECYDKGVVTNASLIVNGIAVEHAVKLAKEHGIPMSLHLNITEGVPVAKASTDNILVDQDGMFLGSSEFWHTAENGQLHEQDVRNEIEAQIDRFETLVGHPPTHVDGHNHVNIAPGVNRAFAEVLALRGIQHARLPTDPIIMSGDWEPAVKIDFFKKLIKFSQQCMPIYRELGIKFNDCFLGLSTMGYDMTSQRLQTGLQRAFASGHNSVCELMVHPGYRTGKVGGCGIGTDSFAKSPEREHEMAVLQDMAFRDFLIQEKITLVPFSECM